MQLSTWSGRGMPRQEIASLMYHVSPWHFPDVHHEGLNGSFREADEIISPLQRTAGFPHNLL